MRRKIVGLLAFAMLAFFVGCVADPSEELGVTEQGLVNPPTNLTANVVSGYQVNLSWDAVANADGYIILKGTASGNETTFTTVQASPTTFTDDHLTPNTQYSYQVKATIAGELSAVSNEVVFTTPNGLAPPTGVTATPVSTTRIDVAWTAAAGASKYYVFRAVGAGPFTYVTTVLGTSFASTGLTPSTTYSFMIHSADPAGRESADSNVATATTPGSAPGLAAPANVTAIAVSSSRIEVSWNAAVGAVKYYVFRAQGAGPYVYVSTTSALSYSSAGLAAATTYSYVIQSVNALDAPSADSTPPATATTFGTGGQALPPANVTATAVSSTRISVTWSAAANAVKYYVYQAAGSSGPFAYVGTVNSPTTNYLATNLAASTEYCYQLQSVDSNDVASVVTTPPACATTFAMGLSARYKFDEASGMTAFDSGGAHSGTLTGAVSYANTNKPPVYDEDFRNASYLSFPGASGDSVTVPEDSLFQFVDAFSVSMWANVSSGGTVHLMGKRAAGCGTTQWDLYQDGTGLHLANATSSIDFGTTLAPGTWTQVGITFDGTIAHLFVNGVETSSAAFAAGARQSVPVTFGNAGGCGNAATLLLDEVRFYSIQLTTGEMGRLGIRPPAPTNMTGVVSSSTAVDLSWDAVSGTELYVIYRGTASGNQTAYTSLSNSTTTFHEGHLVANQTTSWYTRTFRDGLISLPSNEVVLTTDPPPPAPSGVTAVANTGDPLRAEISWTAVPNALKYYLLRSVNGGAYTYVTTISAPGTTVSDAGLASGSTYSYEIITVDQGNSESVASAPASYTAP